MWETNSILFPIWHTGGKTLQKHQTKYDKLSFDQASVKRNDGKSYFRHSCAKFDFAG